VTHACNLSHLGGGRLGGLQFKANTGKKLLRCISINTPGVVVHCNPSYVEDRNRRTTTQGQPQAKKRDPIWTTTKAKRTQVLVHLPSKYEAPSSNPSTTKTKNIYLYFWHTMHSLGVPKPIFPSDTTCTLGGFPVLLSLFHKLATMTPRAPEKWLCSQLWLLTAKGNLWKLMKGRGLWNRVQDSAKSKASRSHMASGANFPK
jgi:hypothetical protein